MKSILITGGAGFIGSHTCLLLLEKGYELFVIDSFINSSSKSIEKVISILGEIDKDVQGKIHLIKGDIKNQSDIELVCKVPHFVSGGVEIAVSHPRAAAGNQEALSPAIGVSADLGRDLDGGCDAELSPAHFDQQGLRCRAGDAPAADDGHE